VEIQNFIIYLAIIAKSDKDYDIVKWKIAQIEYPNEISFS